MSLRSFALSGFMVVCSSDLESFVDLAWNQNANTLSSSFFNTALSLTPALPLCTLCAERVQSPLTPPSGSSRKDSHAQPHTLPRHSSRSAGRGKQQPTPAEVSPTGQVPEHSGTSQPLPTNSAKLSLSTRSAVYVSGQNFSVSRVLSLIFFCSGILTMPMAVTGSAGFRLCHSCAFFSLACRRRKPWGFEL